MSEEMAWRDSAARAPAVYAYADICHSFLRSCPEVARTLKAHRIPSVRCFPRGRLLAAEMHTNASSDGTVLKALAGPAKSWPSQGRVCYGPAAFPETTSLKVVLQFQLLQTVTSLDPPPQMGTAPGSIQGDLPEMT